MTRFKKHFTLIFSLLLTAACGDSKAGDGPATQGNSYQTTSNVGDLSTWTIDGNDLHVVWQDIAPITGLVEKTYTLDGLCGPVNADYGHRTCLIVGDALCEAGSEACAPGDGPQDGETLTVFEVPGLAMIVNVDNNDLHAGFAAGQCEDFETDMYSFVNIGLGQSDIFGLFRTDSDFSEVHHMDFGFSDSPEGQITYRTQDAAGLVAGISASPCVDGVRELTIEESGDVIRLVITSAGHFVLDKPEGEGGMIAINSQNAAVIGDFANKEFGGIVFPDEGVPELIELTTGALNGQRVTVSSIQLSIAGDLPVDGGVYINAGGMGPKLSQALLEPNESYAGNQIVVDGNFPGGVGELPGIFEIDPVSGDETAIVGVGATANGKTILFGAVANEQNTLDPENSDQNGVKGNFILVEK